MKRKVKRKVKRKGHRKVGIITIISYNYGNRLQNYALSKVLSDMGYVVSTVPTKKNYRIKKNISWLLKPLLRKPNNWECFERKIPYANKTYDKLNISKYDFFIAGSDQIWNPYFRSNSKREFLFFAKPEQRISYAASIGISDYPEDKAVEYGAELQKFKAISVRESSAVDIVKRISGRASEVVVDPVLLLSRNEWDSVIGEGEYSAKPYVALYFLGKMNNPCIEVLLQQAIERGLEVKNILEMNKESRGSVGPIEFVNTIRNSRFVITDSFHATVFSILYHRPFINVNRSEDRNAGDMSSRLVTLLSQFEMENRFVSMPEEINFDCFSCDYSNIDEKINNAKEKSLVFLKKSLG